MWLLFTFISLLTKDNLPLVVTLDDNTFPLSSKLKFLNVTLHSSLNFTYFISQKTQSVYFHIQVIKQLRKFIPFATYYALTISLVFFRLDYCSSLLCGQPNYLLRKLQSLQNSAAKRAFKLITLALPVSVLIVCTGYQFPKDASLKFSSLLCAFLSLKKSAYFFDFLSIRPLNPSDPCALASSFINLFF